MLFNSYPFIIFFLPITLFVFFRIGAWGHHRIAISWLVAASLFFYGWWNPAYLGLLIGSVLFAAVGAWVGATIGEKWVGKSTQKSVQIGGAAFVGRLFGTVGKLIMGSSMVVLAIAAPFCFS